MLHSSVSRKLLRKSSSILYLTHIDRFSTRLFDGDETLHMISGKAAEQAGVAHIPDEKDTSNDSNEKFDHTHID